MSNQRKVRNLFRRLRHLKIKIDIIVTVENSQGYFREYKQSGVIKEIIRQKEYEGMIKYALKFNNNKTIEFDITSEVEFNNNRFGSEWNDLINLSMNNGDGTYNHVIIKIKKGKEKIVLEKQIKE